MFLEQLFEHAGNRFIHVATRFERGWDIEPIHSSEIGSYDPRAELPGYPYPTRMIYDKITDSKRLGNLFTDRDMFRTVPFLFAELSPAYEKILLDSDTELLRFGERSAKELLNLDIKPTYIVNAGYLSYAIWKLSEPVTFDLTNKSMCDASVGDATLNDVENFRYYIANSLYIGKPYIVTHIVCKPGHMLPIPGTKLMLYRGYDFNMQTLWYPVEIIMENNDNSYDFKELAIEFQFCRKPGCFVNINL